MHHIHFLATGSMASTMDTQGSMSGEPGYEGVRQRGKTSQFLDSKGFGWLMEVDDDDEDSQTPLL